jgi:hypothetical protein
MVRVTICRNAGLGECRQVRLIFTILVLANGFGLNLRRLRALRDATRPLHGDRFKPVLERWRAQRSP